VTKKRYADFDFSGPSTPGLPPIAVSSDEERFAKWDVFVHTEAVNEPGVYRVVCGLTSEPDEQGRRSLVESTIMVIDSTGAEIARRINLHVKD
jgi:hypothetical protein